MHKEESAKGQVEGAAQRGRVELVDVTNHDLHVVQLQLRRDSSGPLDSGLAEVNADHPPGWAHHLCQDWEPADRTAAAVDHIPSVLYPDPVKGSPRCLGSHLGDAQQPSQVRIAAVKDVMPDAFFNGCFRCVSHTRPPVFPARESRELYLRAHRTRKGANRCPAD
jgi:hypothetical protein